MGVDGQKRSLHPRTEVKVLHHENFADGQGRKTVWNEAQCNAVQKDSVSP